LSEFNSGESVADMRKPWQILGRDFIISAMSFVYPKHS
jgi:hypothetical protein